MQRAAAVDAAKRALDGPSKVEKDAADEDGAEGQAKIVEVAPHMPRSSANTLAAVSGKEGKKA